MKRGYFLFWRKLIRPTMHISVRVPGCWFLFGKPYSNWTMMGPGRVSQRLYGRLMWKMDPGSSNHYFTAE